MKNIIIITILLPLIFTFSNTSEVEISTKTNKNTAFYAEDTTGWVDSVFASLTPDERLAQLFMVAAYPKKGKNEAVKKLITDYKIGGLIMFQGGPVAQAKLTNYYQSISQTPLIIAGDYEWGLSMRLDSTIRYPRQMMLGAIKNDALIFELGKEISRQVKRVGAHINFAPVIDVNNNPANPVINSRSFGEDRENVANKGIAFMFGMQENKVIATAKHFPGHGDTDMDSHKSLPVIKHDRRRLDSIELYPFRKLINAGVGAIMIAHLSIPALDSTKNTASSLSKKIVTNLLKNELHFGGLIFTDALNMKGVSSYFEPGVVDLKAFIAGADILLMSQDVPEAIKQIKQALIDGLITQEEIDERCKKVLKAKRWVGLDKYKPVEIKNIYKDLHTSEAELLKRKLIEASQTLVFNDNDLIPLKKLDSVKIASISIGSGNFTKFQQLLNNYDDVDDYVINKNGSQAEFDLVLKKIKDYDVVIVGIHKMSRRPPNFGITSQTVNFIDKLSSEKAVILNLFGNPYALNKFKDIKRIQAINISYNNWRLTQDIAAQLIYGGIPAQAHLPVGAGGIPSGRGFIEEKIRLKYSVPEEVKIKSEDLKVIDSIILGAISTKATPGCTILAIKNGVIFFNKSYGFHTYQKKNPTQNGDIYDLASITKVAATLPSIMKLYDQKKIDINKKLSYYLPELDSTNKKNIIIRDILAHQARLKPWIPFYLQTFSDIRTHKLNPYIYSSEKTKNYNLQVAESLYITEAYEDTLFQRIFDSKLERKKRYKYSDMGFIMFYRMVEKITKTHLEQYTYDNFYNPLGATTLGYNPLERFYKEDIVPTENDTKYRKQLLQGYVHDYAAAMLGGVCGHAGLFSNADDLAKLAQMYLQRGEYGGRRYIADSTIRYFAKCVACKKGNRRALGFDRTTKSGKGPAINDVSPDSFGHTGFTGTMVWIDPEYQFVYIFLSNRIHPDINNRKLISGNVRAKVQRVFYNTFL